MAKTTITIEHDLPSAQLAPFIEHVEEMARRWTHEHAEAARRCPDDSIVCEPFTVFLLSQAFLSDAARRRLQKHLKGALVEGLRAMRVAFRPRKKPG